MTARRTLRLAAAALAVALSVPVAVAEAAADPETAPAVRRAELLGRFFDDPEAAIAARRIHGPVIELAGPDPVAEDPNPAFGDGGDLTAVDADAPLGPDEEIDDAVDEAGSKPVGGGEPLRTVVDGFEFIVPDRDTGPRVGLPTAPVRPGAAPGEFGFSDEFLAELGTTSPATSPVQTAVGPITCPVPGSRFVNDWGFPRSGGRTHKGTDMFAPYGTPIVAVADAWISKVDAVNRYPATRDLGGITVSYETAAGDRWYNAHLSAIEDGIVVGTKVTQGQVIGYVGTSGNARSTPPHNHIQFHPGGGTAHNPFPIIAGPCAMG